MANGDVVIVSEKDAGMYDAGEQGADSLQRRVIGFLNADDRFHDK